MKKLRMLEVLLLGLLATAYATALADTVTIGSYTAANVFPFGDRYYTGQYEQVYDSAAFQVGNPVVITAMTFFLDNPYPGEKGISGDYQLDFSTTNFSASSLTSSYGVNMGLDDKRFTSGVVADVLTFSGAPFIYDPSKGNLLLYVNAVTGNPILTELQAGCSTDTNRLYGNGNTGAGVGGCSSYGLVTQFTFTGLPSSVTPEPSSVVLLTTGVLMLAGIGRRHFQGTRT